MGTSANSERARPPFKRRLPSRRHTTQNTPKECAPFLVLGDADYRGAFRGYKNSRDTDGKTDREMEGERADTEEDATGISRPRILLKSAAPLPRM